MLTFDMYVFLTSLVKKKKNSFFVRKFENEKGKDGMFTDRSGYYMNRNSQWRANNGRYDSFHSV